jgi:hypothetical protein
MPVDVDVDVLVDVDVVVEVLVEDDEVAMYSPPAPPELVPCASSRHEAGTTRAAKQKQSTRRFKDPSERVQKIWRASS